MENTENIEGTEPTGKKPPAVPSKDAKDENMWAMFCHLASFSGYVMPVPLANIIGPMVVWSIKKEDYPLVSDQGKESVNFQISMMIYYAISFLLLFIVIGFVLIPALMLFQLICVVIAAVKAGEGEAYRYPMCIRFIK